MAEADQRAAQGIANRLPERPAPIEVDDVERPKTDPRRPFERIAVALREQIDSGVYAVGARLPSGKRLGVDFYVSTATAQRAVALLQTWGMLDVSRGRRTVVVRSLSFVIRHGRDVIGLFRTIDEVIRVEQSVGRLGRA